ncbi:MAG: hypothetical protein CMJ37_01045 [Phycisphaerae bacterium]|nr:hypothetical protein [Phycisphaerae bacterium]
MNVPKKLDRYLLETKIGAPATLALCAVAGGHVVLEHITNTMPTLAQDRLQDFVALLGLTNATPVLAALVIGLSLLRHHQQQRSWRFPPWFLIGMGMEAAICTIPLFGLSVLVGVLVPYTTVETGVLALALSAGLYEELVFRLLLIEAGAHVCSTFLGTSRTNAMPYLIGLSGVLFACYHAPLLEGFDVAGLLVYTFGGVWLAVLYRHRGLAIAVLTHVFYDILVLAQ